MKKIPLGYSEELHRVVKWMLKVDPKQRANVEDLLNLPYVSMILRDNILQSSIDLLRRKEDSVKKKEILLKEKEEQLA